MPENDRESTNRLLRVIIALMLRGQEDTPLKEHIRTLSELGMRPAEIAVILGRKGTFINKELSAMRRKGKK
jgi:hypothetical protein